MSYTYLLEQEEEYSAVCFLDIPASVLSRLNLTAEKYYFKGNVTEYCQSFQYGMTYEHSTENRGKEKSMSYAEGFHAKILVQPELELGLMENVVDCGGKCPESLAKFNLDSLSWKTPHCSEPEDCGLCSRILPQWGTMRDGVLLEQQMPERIINEREYGYWPTPSGVKGRGHCVGAISEWGGSQNPFRGTKDRNLRCPDFEEWMMGWPNAWTELTPFAMDKFQQWLDSHGKH